MKPPRWTLPVLFATLLATSPAIERLPIEDFTREPLTSRARISPDGKRLAFLRDFNGRTMLHIADLESTKLTRLDPGSAVLVDDKPKGVAQFDWVSDKRLVLLTTVENAIYGVIAADWDGNHAIPISGYENNRISLSGLQFFATEVIHQFFDKDESILMLDRHSDTIGNARRPDILKLSTASGLHKIVVKNPGEVRYWSLDQAGVARLGILSHGEQSGAIYRP